jgi:hypothetical protein
MRFTLTSLIIALSVSVVPMAGGKPVDAKDDSVTAKIALIMAEPKPDERMNKLNELGLHLSATEIPQALAAAAGFKQWRDRTTLQQAAFRRWAELAPADAFDHMAALPESSLKLQSLHVVAVNWANQDADKAAAAATRLSSGPARMDAINTIATIWAHTNVTKALAWADSFPEGNTRQSTLNSIFGVWVQKDPAACWVRAQKLPPGNNRNGLIIKMAFSWAAQDPSGAIQWANALPNEAEKELAVQDVVEAWAETDPVAAGEFALKLPPGSAREFTIAGVAAVWGMQNPHLAAAWIMEKLDPASQQRAVSRFLMFWAAVDPQASGQWVESLPAGAIRDTAISTYIDTACYWTPERAAKLALSLTDETTRRQKLEVCLEHWKELDTTSLPQWLKTAPLPADLKDRWLAQLSATSPQDPTSHP